MSPDVIQAIIARCGYAPGLIAARESGYRNHSYRLSLPAGQELNLMLYKRELGIVARIRRAGLISDYLEESGFPTRRQLGPGIVRLNTATGSRYAALYTYLPGRTIPWEAYTQAHLKLLGQSLAQMHRQLALLPLPAQLTLPLAAKELQVLNSRMGRYFDTPTVTAASRAKLHVSLRPGLFDHFAQLLYLGGRLPGPQPLHLDFVRGNLLFEPSESGLRLTGILDFEKTAVGHPIIDIARTLAFLLVDSRYKTHAQVRKYFLESGYIKRGESSFRPMTIHLGTRTIKMLDELVGFFLVYDFYKFLRHNPYESLPQNEHYVRTAGLLLELGLLSSIPADCTRLDRTVMIDTSTV